MGMKATNVQLFDAKKFRVRRFIQATNVEYFDVFIKRRNISTLKEIKEIFISIKGDESDENFSTLL